MLLATGPSFEFVRLIQILCWILLPIGAVAILLTVFLHYRQKRKANQLANVSDEDFLNASPELLGYTNGDGEYIVFDQSSVIAEFKKKLFYYHARYTALRHDFDRLDSKYAELAGFTLAKFTNRDLDDMESVRLQIPKSLQVEIDKISAQYKGEREELIRQSNQAMNFNVEEIASLKNVLAESMQQNQLLQARAADYENLAHSLKSQLSAAEAANELLSEKLATDMQLLQQQNKDISSTLIGEKGQPPIVILSPEYAVGEDAVVHGG